MPNQEEQQKTNNQTEPKPTVVIPEVPRTEMDIQQRSLNEIIEKK